ncbi:phage integrase [Vibrio vulnificus YJ016]|uniref:Phage integrase n=2 Tax=Vibrio vulnificus TaxID=672 RepID=Q7ME27_VIBVY|nr:site-specific integrase [Vibrio vulnificus]MBN8120512.1 site-specific integrase [Vibrio vulnificus]BAC96883.1 phage integrase [Vibrio vulnificus YJ016]HAS6407675.1 tyrosine-type recombinase/integrase [Vibrio vulnificus]HAS6412497.1 tyrosine-type recombinase/integrase [Vibrio vulnificus]HBH7890687.1 site-specific integrase [Vibrio vulnificus]
MRTLETVISDAAIKRHLADGSVYQLKDPRYSLYLRYNTARTGGSWLLVHYAKGKQRRSKIGAWPVTSSKVIFDRLGAFKAEIGLNPSGADVCIGQFTSVGDLLRWYQVRVSKNRSMSKSRKVNTKSMIKCHLLPMLGDIELAHVSRQVLDAELMWPLQERYEISMVRCVFAALKVAFKQAKKLKLIEDNPLADLRFSDFIDATIAIKDAKVRPEHVKSIIESLGKHDEASQALVVMILAHGTRIGETRQARWDHIDFDSREWFIPSENTKTKSAHRLPLTDDMIGYLKQYRASQKSDSVFLFPSARKRSVMSASNASKKIKAVSNGQWTAHDLRKVARTVWADLGVDYMVSEILLNHALSKLDKTYVHTFVEAKKREALTSYQVWLNLQSLL